MCETCDIDVQIQLFVFKRKAILLVLLVWPLIFVTIVSRHLFYSDDYGTFPQHGASFKIQPGANSKSELQRSFEVRTFGGKTTLSENRNNTAAGDSSLLHGDRSKVPCNMSEYLRILGHECQIQKPVNVQTRNSCRIEHLYSDCDGLRKSYIYGKDGITFEEKIFPLAYALKIHTSANQAHRLLRYIYYEHNVYCIHVDKKAPEQIYMFFKGIEKCFDNIVVVDDPVTVVYSSIRQVQAELKCMQILNTLKTKWKYYINLTGQEFMLKTNLEIVNILKLLNSTNNIETAPNNQEEKIIWKRTIDGNRLKKMPIKNKRFHKDVEIRKGLAYGMFTRDFVHYVLNDTFVKDLLLWFENTFSPEEFIWATLQKLPNSPGGCARTKCTKFISREIIWIHDPKRTVQCHGKYVRYVCIYGLKDVPRLLTNENVVANKFYDNYQPLALDCLEQGMYKRLTNGGRLSFDLNEYKKLLA